MPGRNPEFAQVDAELKIKLEADEKLVEKFRNNLAVGAIEVHGQKALPMLSRVKVLIDKAGDAKAIILIAEVVREEGDEMDLQILDLKSEDKLRLIQWFKDLENEARSPKPSVARSLIPREGKLFFDFTSAMRRNHHEGKDCLHDPNIFSLLTQLSTDRFTGKLTLTGEDRAVTTVYWNGGHLIGATRNPTEESHTIGFMLRRNGLLTETQYREIKRERETTGKSDQTILTGKIENHDLQVYSLRVLKYVIGIACASREIQYKIEWGNNHLAGISPIGVNLKRATFRAMVEAAGRYRTDELMSGFEPFLNHYVVQVKDLPVQLDDLKLEKDEERFWNVTVAKPTRLRQLFAVSALSKMQSVRMLYALHFSGMVEFLSHIQPEESQVVQHLTEVLIEMEKVSHFDALHVHWTALRPQIEAAWERSRKVWESLEIPFVKQAQAEPLRKAILDLLKKARDFLMDDPQRRTYRDGLVEPSMREFTAELFSDHTNSELYRGNFEQAQYYIEMSVDLCPGNQKYRELQRQAVGRRSE